MNKQAPEKYWSNRRWRSAVIGIQLVAILPCISLAVAEEPLSMDRMIAEADHWILKAGSRFSGSTLQLPEHLSKNSRTAMLSIYSHNWAAVQKYADERLTDLPWVDPKRFADRREEFEAESSALAEFAKLADSEGALLTIRLFDPAMLGNVGYSILTGSKLAPDDLARNSLIGAFVSSETFRTTLDDTPAIGVSRGYWTVITAYSRSEHGLFAPTNIAMFKRSKEN